MQTAQTRTHGSPLAFAGAGVIAPALVALAVAAPPLLAYQQPPSATLYAQCLAVALWGAAVAVLAPRRVPRAAWPALGALALLALAVLAAWAWRQLPTTLALLPLGLLVATAAVLVAGADAARRGDADRIGLGLAWGLLAMGLLSSAIAGVQVFWPQLADGQWIAASPLSGRAIGNIRQPNLLCCMLLWAYTGAVLLHVRGHLNALALWAAAACLVGAVALTGSRTGAIGLGLLLCWGLLDRRLPPAARRVLVAAPVLYAVALVALLAWGAVSTHSVGAAARLAADAGAQAAVADSPNSSPNSRLNIWRNAMALVASHPWAGVGFGGFNLAWTLTPFEHRPVAVFDHAHNLPLHLAAELGLPLAAAVLGLLGRTLWLAARAATAPLPPAASVTARAMVVLVLLVALFSLLEYPLWFAYFLLPAALALGLACGAVPESTAAATTAATAAAATPATGPSGFIGGVTGVLVALAGTVAAMDYRIVTEIHVPPPDSGPLAHRVARGQISPLLAHHADYAAAVMDDVPPYSRLLGIQRGMHHVLDTRLMVAWATALHAAGHADAARWLAQRVRDFHQPEAAVFLAPCASTRGPGAGPLPFQCQPAERTYRWDQLVGLPLKPREDVAAPAAAASAAR